MRIWTAILALPLLVLPVRGDEKIDTAKASEQAETIKKAVLAGDFAKVADLTHPKVVVADIREPLSFTSAEVLERVTRLGDLFAPVQTLQQELPR